MAASVNELPLRRCEARHVTRTPCPIHVFPLEAALVLSIGDEESAASVEPKVESLPATSLETQGPSVPESLLLL